MPFDFQPRLSGQLVTLRPLAADDFDELYGVAADPLIWQQHPDRDRYRKDVFQRFFRDALGSGGALAIVDNRDGLIIGSSRFHGYDPARREVEIGWTFLARSHWGGRFNGEVKRLMLQHALKYVNSVILLVVRENVRSCRAVEKIGGVLVGTSPDASGRESLVYRVNRGTPPDVGREPARGRV
jgi:RimJ/RimL family protein N-acetyltransferase